MNNRLYTPENAALILIRREWAYCLGAVTVAILLSLCVSPLWTPGVDIILAIGLVFVNPGKNYSSDKPCGRLISVTVLSLIISGVISLGIDIVYQTEMINILFDSTKINVEIPYISTLIIFPVLAITSLFGYSKKIALRHSRLCHLYSDYNPSQPIYGRIVHGVYRSLLRLLFILTLVISIIDWGYYFISYKNETLSSPDRFFFFFIPVIVYLWSLVYVNHNYSAIILSNGLKFTGSASSQSVTDSSILRFLIIHNGRLLLNVSDETISQSTVDTPVKTIKPLSFHGDVQIARQEFTHLTGVENFRLRKLYLSENTVLNTRIYHFLVTIPEDASLGNLKGEWTTLDNIDRMLKLGLTSPRLGAEIFRIYTITMAWKTYDSKGHRLYPIRNYRPTFRLTDIDKWTVDYEDLHWLRVARINQDTPFYFIRKLFL